MPIKGLIKKCSIEAKNNKTIQSIKKDEKSKTHHLA